MFEVERLDHVGFTAQNVDALARWNETVFGMKRVHSDAWPDVAGGHPLVLCVGEACIALFQAREGVEPRPRSTDVNEHIALVLDHANFEQAQRDLDALGIPYEVWDHGICDSLYLEDPDGHQIELTAYRPEAKDTMPPSPSQTSSASSSLSATVTFFAPGEPSPRL